MNKKNPIQVILSRVFLYFGFHLFILKARLVYLSQFQTEYLKKHTGSTLILKIA